ncbi:NB-ARC domain-containing protein [Paractinoplanes lichenicola]|uniref:Orc1-like AAA ATPase domain-containing protein n=1 Tax=Paractinoplanes lichenicola TaxID=2802976 RepID=A0ABS1VYL5_9ACTN|nr:tetratricopeptide repeat protein [Actinoplanes lichenicola]MBL7259583.1 hypothetical protein [Actinoplanes lichenicola]
MTAPVTTSNLPQRPYERFVGRAAELASLLARMSPDDRTWVVVVDGIGGVGKTSLALEAAYRLSEGPGRFDFVVWVSAKRDTLTAHGILPRRADFVNLRDVFEAIGSVCGRPDLPQLPEGQQRTLIRTLLGGPRRVLLVLDNLETVDDESVTAFLRDLPTPAKAIVTSRHRIDVALSIRLEGLGPAESEELIRSEAGLRGLTLTDAEVAGLARRSGGVPVAVLWSLGLMSLGHGTASVLRRLGSGTGDIAEFCFDRSVEALGDGDALKMLVTAALFEAPVGRDLLGQAAGLGSDVIGRDDALQRLIQLSLINSGPGGFSLLPLTRTYTLRLLGERPGLWREAEDDWFRAMLAVAADYRGSNVLWRDRARLRTVGPHFETAYAMTQNPRRAYALAAFAAALIGYYDVVGRWDDLVDVAGDLESYGRTAGDDDAVSDAVWALNWVYGQRGEFEAARASLERAAGSITTPVHRIQYLLGCAQTSRRAGQRDDALAFVKLADLVLPQLDPVVVAAHRANVAFERGKIARDDGDWEEADLWFGAASLVFDFDEAQGAIAGGHQPASELERSLGLIGNRAVVEHRRGNLAAATDMLRRALLFTREHGSVSNVATLLVRLAVVLIDQGEYEEARGAVTEARELASATGMQDELNESARLLALLSDR